MKRSILKVALSTALITSVGFSSELTLCGSKVEFKKSISLNKLSSYSLNSEEILAVIHTKDSLTQKDKSLLYKQGIKAIEYAGVNSYYIVSSLDDINSIVDEVENIDGVALVKPQYKIDKELKDISINSKVKVKISLLGNIDKQTFIASLNKNNIEYEDISFQNEINMVELTTVGMDIEKISEISAVKQISKYHKIALVKPFSAEIKPNDIGVIDEISLDDVWRVDSDLDGMNIPIGIVDEGRVRKNHVEFMQGQVSRVKDKVIKGDSSLHSTHIAGILGAKGVNQNAKGIAMGAIIYNFSYKDNYFAESISKLASRYGILLSNHSYGFTDKVDLGVYNSDAANEDKVVYNNPYINVFVAAGNDRGSKGYPDISIIKGAANAKNVLTIGALDHSSSDVAYYSSVGPVYDGRIKPDLSVQGSSVYSTSNSGDKGYAYMTGTSMAAPSATAMAALVMQEYKKVTNCGNNIGCDMRSDVLKAVLINTAIDKNIPGPDIYTGFGMINAKDAIECVKSLDYDNQKHQIKLDVVGKGAIKEYRFSTTRQDTFKVTLAWVDPAGNSASSGRTLVNDVDIYLLDLNSGKKYYPYSLDKANPTAIALNDRANRVDVVEKIEVNSLPAGEYKLVVSGENIQSSSQRYALASNEAIFDKSSVNDTPKVKLEVRNFAKIMLESIY